MFFNVPVGSSSSVLSAIRLFEISLDKRAGKPGRPGIFLASWARSREEERAWVFPGRGGGEGGTPSFFCNAKGPLTAAASGKGSTEDWM